jgi:hypothetical protein
MQENLEPFGVKIESSFRTEAETQIGRAGEVSNPHHEPGAEIQVERGVRKRALPQPMIVADDVVVAVSADDGVVGNWAGAVQLEGEAAGATHLKADPRGAGLSLGDGGGGAEQSYKDHQEGGKKRREQAPRSLSASRTTSVTLLHPSSVVGPSACLP